MKINEMLAEKLGPHQVKSLQRQETFKKAYHPIEEQVVTKEHGSQLKKRIFGFEQINLINTTSMLV